MKINKVLYPVQFLRYGINWRVVEQHFRLPRHGKAKNALKPDEASKDIARRICEGKPLFSGRLGHTENYAILEHEFLVRGWKKAYSAETIRSLREDSGMFSNTKEGIAIFSDYYREAIELLTHYICWDIKAETYWINNYCSKSIRLIQGDGHFFVEHPWTEKLKGKRVLVVSSFAKTIQSQYLKREHLFSNPEALPEFACLKTVQAPTTFAGSDIYPTWESALLDTYDKCLRAQCDIALLGCGSYALPLGGLLFKKGIQVMVLNSEIQLLFGIKGKRWDTQPWAEGIRSMYNEHWIYPSSEERPAGWEKVDFGRGDYWQ